MRDSLSFGGQYCVIQFWKISFSAKPMPCEHVCRGFVLTAAQLAARQAVKDHDTAITSMRNALKNLDIGL